MVKTFDEVRQWCNGANLVLEDPAGAVCHMFFRWVEDFKSYRGTELAAGMIDGEFVLVLQPGLVLPIEIGEGNHMEIDSHGELEAYGVDQVMPGLWAMNPSLNIPGVIHGFVTIYDVARPAPWERRIILPEEVGRTLVS